MPVPILAAVRSPFAVADGALAGWHPVDLAAEIAAVAVERAAVDPATIDAVWVGCDEPVGAQGANVARRSSWRRLAGPSLGRLSRRRHSGECLSAAADAIRPAGGHGVVSVCRPRSCSLAHLLWGVYGRPWGEGPAARYAMLVACPANRRGRPPRTVRDRSSGSGAFGSRSSSGGIVAGGSCRWGSTR